MRTTPIVPWPHMPRYPALSKNTTPASEPGSTGGVSSAPTTAAWPRGSQTTARRSSSWRRRSSSRRSAMVAPATSPQPSTTTRVGSPSVWESTTVMRSGKGMRRRRLAGH